MGEYLFVNWPAGSKQMFDYAEQPGTYESDYRFLSALAHSSGEELIFRYSRSEVVVRSTEHVGVLVVYASRYYMVITEIWDRVFDVIDAEWFATHAKTLNEWKLNKRRSDEPEDR